MAAFPSSSLSRIVFCSLSLSPFSYHLAVSTPAPPPRSRESHKDEEEVKALWFIPPRPGRFLPSTDALALPSLASSAATCAASVFVLETTCCLDAFDSACATRMPPLLRLPSRLPSEEEEEEDRGLSEIKSTKDGERARVDNEPSLPPLPPPPPPPALPSRSARNLPSRAAIAAEAPSAVAISTKPQRLEGSGERELLFLFLALLSPPPPLPLKPRHDLPPLVEVPRRTHAETTAPPCLENRARRQASSTGSGRF